MKKHKVKIPKGYILVNESKTKIDGFMTITLGLEPISMEKELPKAWEELGNTPAWLNDDTSGFFKHIPKKHRALGRLEILRDYYNDGWKPKYNSDDTIYFIIRHLDSVICDEIYNCAYPKILAFRTENLRDAFLDNFTELIEIAKPLL